MQITFTCADAHEAMDVLHFLNSRAVSQMPLEAEISPATDATMEVLESEPTTLTAKGKAPTKKPTKAPVAEIKTPEDSTIILAMKQLIDGGRLDDVKAALTLAGADTFAALTGQEKLAFVQSLRGMGAQL